MFDKITRSVISSTLVTNALTENILDPVFLAVISGPGMNVSQKFPCSTIFFLVAV